jgi:NADPH:quinone reductase-like Zn-dependent oxidoreductase
MQAVTVSKYGAVPAFTQLPTPIAGPGQLLIRIRAAA